MCRPAAVLAVLLALISPLPYADACKVEVKVNQDLEGKPNLPGGVFRRVSTRTCWKKCQENRACKSANMWKGTCYLKKYPASSSTFRRGYITLSSSCDKSPSRSPPPPPPKKWSPPPSRKSPRPSSRKSPSPPPPPPARKTWSECTYKKSSDRQLKARSFKSAWGKNASACQKLCDAESRCKAYEHKRSGGGCFLKADTDTKFARGYDVYKKYCSNASKSSPPPNPAPKPSWKPAPPPQRRSPPPPPQRRSPPPSPPARTASRSNVAFDGVNLAPSGGGFRTMGGGRSGTAITTRYWDCCKPSSGWGGKSYRSSVVRTCQKDGRTTAGDNEQSVCNGGGAHTCSDNAPFVRNGVGYGFVAAGIGREEETSCSCYELTFPNGNVMAVQATNIGGDLGKDQFDILMPGGGLGVFDGCSSQFGGGIDWGKRYGGVFGIAACKGLPSELRSGCEFRFTFLSFESNPTVQYRQIECPSTLTSISGCTR